MAKGSKRSRLIKLITCPYCLSQQHPFCGNPEALSVHLFHAHRSHAHKLEDIERWHIAKYQDSKLCKFCDKMDENLIAHYRLEHRDLFELNKSNLTGKWATKSARTRAAQRIRELWAYIIEDKPLPAYPPSENSTNSSVSNGSASSQPPSQHHHQLPPPAVCRNFGNDNNYNNNNNNNNTNKDRNEDTDCQLLGLPDIDFSAAAAAAADALAHPAVTPTELIYFEHVATLVRPTSLRPVRLHGHLPNKKTASCDVEFCLTRQQAESVALMRTRDPKTGRSVNGMQILLRCFKAEPGLQADSFPSYVTFSVNSLPVRNLPNPLPVRCLGADPVIPGAPVDITCFCRVGNSAINRLRVTWLHKILGAGHCLSVTLARVVTPSELTKRLLLTTEKIRPASDTQQRIRQLLLVDDNSSGGDAAVAMTTLSASLKCPLSRTRIEVPVRGTECRHVQCFDAKTYLAMNERKATWKCPCCDRPTPYSTLRVDAHFLSVLSEASDSVDTVRFLDDGTWQPLLSDADSLTTSSSGSSSNGKKRRKTAGADGSLPVIDSIDIVDEDDEDEPSDQPSKRPRRSAPAGGGGGSRRRAATVSLSERSDSTTAAASALTVDLTGDSD